MSDPVFLTLAEVIDVHTDQVDRYGGQNGLRERGLLQSALAQPEASYGGEWLHTDLYAMAAAYAHPICQNHPFIDGNKRTALACTLVFLELNGISVMDPKGHLADTMLQVASGKMKKSELADRLKLLPKANQ